MPFFGRFRSARESPNGVPSDSAIANPKPEPYRHIPVHAARDARSQVPPSARESDREAIAEHHKRRSQMPHTHDRVLWVNTGAVVDDWYVGQRDVPYVNREKPPTTSARPTTALKELHNINAQRRTRASRRAAHIEPTAEVSYHLGLLPSPLAQSMSLTANGPDPPSIPLPIRTRPPMPEFDNDVRRRYNSRERVTEKISAVNASGVATRSNSSSGSSTSTTIKSRVSSTSSQEPLHPPPSGTRARDSLSRKIVQDSRFHKPKSSSGRRLRAAAHDSTGLEQAMASPESFRPQRAPPVILRNDSAYPALPMAGFDFGTERPYSPERLRPWLVNNKHNAFQSTSRMTSV